MILYTLFFCLVLCYIFLRVKDRKLYKLSKQLNNDVLTIPFIGHLYLGVGNSEDHMKTLINFGRKALNKGGLCAAWFGTKLFTVVADPVTFDFLSKTCLEKDDFTKCMKPLMGNGSIFAPVSIWRPRRKAMTSHFGMGKLNSFVDIFSQQSQIMVEVLKKFEGKGTVSIQKYLAMYSLDSIIETTTGVKVNAQSNSNHPFPKAFEEYCGMIVKHYITFILTYIYNLPLYKLTSDYATFVRNYCYIRDFVNKVIKSKREDHEKEKEEIVDFTKKIQHHKPQTFLDAMIKTSDNDHTFSDEELFEELIVLILAGTDTSTVGAGFVAMMLARHPKVQDKVYKELLEVLNNSDRPVTAKDLTQLKYMEAVIKESLRLYPPGPITIRKIDKDVTIPSGLTLVKGSSIVLHTWAINRNPQYWGLDADEFKPERFIDCAPRHPAAYATFSFGPRNCIGYKYAILSMKTVIANLLRDFILLPAEALDTCINNGKCLEKEKPLRVRYEVMMKNVDDFKIRLESRIKVHS